MLRPAIPFVQRPKMMKRLANKSTLSIAPAGNQDQLKEYSLLTSSKCFSISHRRRKKKVVMKGICLIQSKATTDTQEVQTGPTVYDVIFVCSCYPTLMRWLSFKHKFQWEKLYESFYKKHYMDRSVFTHISFSGLLLLCRRPEEYIRRI